MLLGLRTVADAVLVGPGTIRVEGYGRLVGDAGRRARRVEAGQVADPPCVLFSRRVDIPWEAGLFDAAEQPVIIYTGAANATAPDCKAPVEVVRLDDYSSAAALRDLHGRGVRALLSEGGPTLFRGLLDAGVVDELFLTLAPQLVAGTEQQILPGPPLDPAVELRLQWVLQAEQELFPALPASLAGVTTRGLLVAALLTLAAPASAHAATLTNSLGRLTYVAAPGMKSDITADEATKGTVTLTTANDDGDPITATGCTMRAPRSRARA